MVDEPTYEVKLKGDTITPTTPAEPAKPTLTEDQISSMVDSKAQEKANAIATSKVEELKQDLADKLSGKQASRYGKDGPESWDKLHENITADATSKAVKAAEERIEKRLADEKKATEDKAKMTQKQQEDSQKAEYAKMSADWNEAVQDGVLPDISKEVKAKLKSGVVYADLTEAEQRDPGLKAYNEARLLHIQLKNEGKSNSFYRTASQFYRRQPAGARAPVIGGSASTPGGSGEELSYAEVQANRKSKFGF